MYRSVTTELDLEAGKYSVIIKITASRDKSKTTPQEIVKKNCQTRPEKLMAVGLSYDLAHAKGRLQESGLERRNVVQRERREKRKLEAKEAFEAKRIADKKEKLRRLRLVAKEKARKGKLLDPFSYPTIDIVHALPYFALAYVKTRATEALDNRDIAT